ncbi:hypothetical protein FA95DRAFT_1499565 [Auriscalpium vulgare]|uniref:Uncharacterized protein n=1 Tax=Auriscalpium vulgare TaxID=40419 RepID=A0ACB8RGT4_9AGAM|nr:hypothetical protein FA95DRAFT_1499565 [Auriscalpium vulgare]
MSSAVHLAPDTSTTAIHADSRTRPRPRRNPDDGRPPSPRSRSLSALRPDSQDPATGRSRGGDRKGKGHRDRRPPAGEQAGRPRPHDSRPPPPHFGPQVPHHGDAGLIPSADGVKPPPPRPNRQRYASRPADTAYNSSDSAHAGDARAGPSNPPRHPKRTARFNGKLSETKASAPSPAVSHYPAQAYSAPVPKDDLTSTLIHELSTPPYLDCAICFNSIHPAQPSWSCSPLIPAARSPADSASNDKEPAQYCWTTFHLKCIKSWAAKSVKDVEEAWRARGEEKKGEWRCPGCQLKREVVPRAYWCFCGHSSDPKPTRLATPHSCGNACSRAKECGHPCPLSCHPGPCPPCMITTQTPCYCGKHTISAICSRMSLRKNGKAAPPNLSCGNGCRKMLSCSNHACQDVCHPGECTPCTVREVVRCWCGKEEKELACGEGEVKESVLLDGGVENRWSGRFACDNPCDRPFDCGVHKCSQSCHPPSRTPPVCPRSVSVVTHCACGKHALADPTSVPFFTPRTRLIRTACTDPIPTCTSLCLKPLDNCDHVCSVPCHTGPCPPCTIPLVRPCRCGSTTREVSCSASRTGAEETELLCDRQCGALRACGRHQCNRLCCPLAVLAGAGKGKKRRPAAGSNAHQDMVDEAGWHECELVCGKMLSCGNHRCERRDHKGPCPSCLQSSFEEMICHCGRTVLDPPIPCGTRIECSYPCSRAPPSCGHPKAPHACHEDPVSCPPCVFLTSKRCACGKKEVENVRCSQERVSCGTPCGKLLSCGGHRCERLCHGDACGPCTAVCGKPRKLCGPAQHPCTQPCHAPSVCPEFEPCLAVITITCQCGRIRQPVPCGRSTGNPAGREGAQQLKCTPDCAIAKRNARLAEALGINPDAQNDKHVIWSDELVAFARSDVKFLGLVEKTFADFATSDKKVQVLPHMPEARRKFVHDLAAVYRMDTQMVDQEPYRSVQLIRRIDTRIPSPLLSASLPSTPSNGLGKLADLRAPPSQWPRIQSQSPAPVAAGKGRGWTAVVARPAGTKTPPVAPAPVAAASWRSAGASSARTVATPASAAVSVATVSRRATPPVVPAPVREPAPAAGLAGTSVVVPDDWEDDV